ncbi:hypothetical protein VIGAN_06055800 [Vigna angularis var. angularis]|nr:hypothetical protein VIGAN_06055800 [Vigna angularis var. angularis]
MLREGAKAGSSLYFVLHWCKRELLPPNSLNPAPRVRVPVKEKNQSSDSEHKLQGPKGSRPRRLIGPKKQIGRMIELIQVLSWKQSESLSELVEEDQPRSF